MLKRPAGASRREANGGVERAERSDGARRARQGRGCGPCARTGKYPKSVEGGRNAGRQAARGGAANGARRSRRRRRTALRRADGTKRTAAAHRAPRPAFRPVRLARPRIGSDSGGDGSGRGTAAGAGTGARLGRRRPSKKGGPAWNRGNRDAGPLLARNRARRARRRRRQHLVTPPGEIPFAFHEGLSILLRCESQKHQRGKTGRA